MKMYTLLYFCLISLLSFSCNKAKNAYQILNSQLDEITIADIHSGYDNNHFTVKELVSNYIDRIKSIDQSGPRLNSIIVINPDALSIADSLDERHKLGKKKGPLFGIPVLLKDNIDVRGKMPTTAGSRILKESFPLRDSWVAKKLKASGAIILGKTNLSEWANYRSSYSSSGWSGISGQTKNPYVLDRNPCGSSSGSAVSVSANLCVVSIGTETWGSIMCPSNANGIVGIKPTVGLWSRSGIVPISYTQDTAGPMSRTVRDAAIILGTVTGVDGRDKKTKKSKDNHYKDYTKFLNVNGLQNKRIGYVRTMEGKNHRVDLLMQEAIKDIRENGAEVIPIDNIFQSKDNKNNPEKNSLEVMAYEFKDGLKTYFGSLGPNAPVKDLKDVINQTLLDSVEMLYFNIERLENAETKGDLNSKAYKEALQKMKTNAREMGIDRVMKEYNLDAFISPTGSPAWKTDLVNGDKYYISTTVFAALSGYPNINVPMGFIDNVPIGISFYGRAWSEPQLIEIAYSYEQKTMHRKKPEFLVSD